MEELIVKYLKKEASPEEVKQLQYWAAADQRHRNILCKYENLWNSLDTQIPEPNTSEAWIKIKSRVESSSTHSSPKVFLWYRVAAVVAFLLISGIAVFYFSGNDVIDTPIEKTVVATAKQKVTLPDGTLVWLKKDAELSFPSQFSGNKRKVELAGEGYFEVKRNPEKPFIVATKSTTTTVLGTAFNINAPEKGETTLTVTRGKVSFQGKDNAKNIILVKDQQGIYKPQSQEIELSEVVDPNALAWQTEKMVFTNSSLPYVCDVLEEVYGKQFDIKDSQLRQLSLNAVFEHQSLEEILLIIEKTLDIRIEKTGNDRFTINRDQ